MPLIAVIDGKSMPRRRSPRLDHSGLCWLWGDGDILVEARILSRYGKDEPNVLIFRSPEDLRAPEYTDGGKHEE